MTAPARYANRIRRGGGRDGWIGIDPMIGGKYDKNGKSLYRSTTKKPKGYGKVNAAKKEVNRDRTVFIRKTMANLFETMAAELRAKQ